MMHKKIIVLVLMTAVLMPGCSTKSEKSDSVTDIPTASKLSDSGAQGTPTNQETLTGQGAPTSEIKSIVSNTPDGTVGTISNDPSSGDLHGKLVKKSKKVQYIDTYDIGSKYENLEITHGERNIFLGYNKISGLADKQVEKSINDSIINNLKGATMEEINIRGEDDWPVGMNSFIALSANNLLSVSTTYFDSNPIHGLLFRLSDGKKLGLKDIFTKGTDYVSLLNKQVELAILEGEIDEGEILYKPFSGIKPDQEFLLNYSDLYIIFRKGEGGFVKDHSVKVPLYRIYDYIDIFDHDYSSSVYENPQLVVHRNNIFLINKSEVRNVGSGDLWVLYDIVTGTGDEEFEKAINNKIRNGIEDLVKLNIWNDLSKSKKPEEYIDMRGHIGEIEIVPEVNQDGILSFTSYIRTIDASIKVEEYKKTFTCDLINKKMIDKKS